MKKILLFGSFLLTGTMVFSQSSRGLKPAINGEALVQRTGAASNSGQRAFTCQDTLQYPLLKQQAFIPNWASNFNSFEIWKQDNEAISQTFLHSGGNVTISAVQIYGSRRPVANTAATAQLKASIYNVDANNNPTTLLGSGTLNVTDTVNRYRMIPLSAPVTATGNYAVVIDLGNANSVFRFFVTSATANQPIDENLSRYISDYYDGSNGNWVSIPALTSGSPTDFGGNTFDFEALLAPVVNYSMSAAYTVTPGNSFCLGTQATFTNTTTPAGPLSSRMYNFNTFLKHFNLAAADSHYVWDMDDNSPLIWNTNATHTFAASGSYDVTLAALGGFWVTCNDVVTQTITVNNAAADASFSFAGGNTFCAGSTNPVPTVVTPGGTFSAGSGLNFVSTATGVINLATSTPGTYTVTYTTSGACPATSTQSITINASDNATFSYPTNTFCSGSANPVATTSAAGTFSATAGLNFVSTTTGEINLATTANGTYSITYTTSGACPGTSTQSVTITDSPDASFTYAANAYCVDGTNPSPVFGTGAGAGTFSSANGLSINANTGVINLAASTPGTYTVTNSIAASGSCAATSDTYDVTINALPVVTFNGSAVCANVATVTLAATPAGGTYTGTGVTGNTFATSNGTQPITYSYTDANGCTNTANATVTVNPLPTVDAITNQSLCPGQSSTAINFTSPVVGSTFAWTNNQPSIGLAASGNGNIAAFTVANSTGSAVVSTISVTATSNGCAGTPSTFTITVNNNPTVAFTTLPATICVYNNPITLTGATPAGGTYSGTGVTGTSFNPTTAGLGTKTITYTYTDGNSCSGTATANIEVSECLSVEDLVAAGNLAIYPNPASDVVTFGFSNSTVANVNVAIVSLDGKTVYQNQFQSNQGSIDVSTFARGTYLVRIQAEGKTSTAKLILN